MERIVVGNKAECDTSTLPAAAGFCTEQKTEEEHHLCVNGYSVQTQQELGTYDGDVTSAFQNCAGDCHVKYFEAVPATDGVVNLSHKTCDHENGGSADARPEPVSMVCVLKLKPEPGIDVDLQETNASPHDFMVIKTEPAWAGEGTQKECGPPQEVKTCATDGSSYIVTEMSPATYSPSDNLSLYGEIGTDYDASIKNSKAGDNVSERSQVAIECNGTETSCEGNQNFEDGTTVQIHDMNMTDAKLEIRMVGSANEGPGVAQTPAAKMKNVSDQVPTDAKFTEKVTYEDKQGNGESFECVLCLVSMDDVQDLLKHALQKHRPFAHDGISLVYCPRCRKSLRSAEGLSNHLYFNHFCRKRKLFECTLCSKIFTERKAAKRHVQNSNDGKWRLNCVQCGIRFCTKDDFLAHEKQCLESGPCLEQGTHVEKSMVEELPVEDRMLRAVDKRPVCECVCQHWRTNSEVPNWHKGGQKFQGDQKEARKSTSDYNRIELVHTSTQTCSSAHWPSTSNEATVTNVQSQYMHAQTSADRETLGTADWQSPKKLQRKKNYWKIWTGLLNCKMFNKVFKLHHNFAGHSKCIHAAKNLIKRSMCIKTLRTPQILQKHKDIKCKKRTYLLKRPDTLEGLAKDVQVECSECKQLFTCVAERDCHRALQHSRGPACGCCGHPYQTLGDLIKHIAVAHPGKPTQSGSVISSHTTDRRDQGSPVVCQHPFTSNISTQSSGCKCFSAAEESTQVKSDKISHKDKPIEAQNQTTTNRSRCFEAHQSIPFPPLSSCLDLQDTGNKSAVDEIQADAEDKENENKSMTKSKENTLEKNIDTNAVEQYGQTIKKYSSVKSRATSTDARSTTHGVPFVACAEGTNCSKNRKRRGSFPCHICGKYLTLKSNLLTHIRVVHADKNVIKCASCKLIFKTREEFDSHRLQKHLLKSKRFMRKHGFLNGALNKDDVPAKGVEDLHRVSNAEPTSDGHLGTKQAADGSSPSLRDCRNTPGINTQNTHTNRNPSMHSEAVEKKITHCDIGDTNLLGDQKLKMPGDPDITECLTCKLLFPTTEDLYVHQTTIHNTGHQFGDCSKTLESTKDFCLHQCHVKKRKCRRSSGNKKGLFPCDECGKTFTFKNNLTTHIKFIHDADGMIKCKSCKKIFPSQKQLEQHKAEKHSKSKCVKVGKKRLREVGNREGLSITQEENLNTKSSLAETNEPSNVSLTLQSKTGGCDQSSGGEEVNNIAVPFPKVAARETDKNSGKTEESLMSVADAHSASKPKTAHAGIFNCDLCGTTFTFRSNLSTHKKIIHAHHSVISCRSCKKIFKCQEDLDLHKALKHRGCPQDCENEAKLKKSRNFLCSLCGKTFTFRSNFNAHKKIIHAHHSVISCRSCKKIFKCQEDLDEHKALKHSGRLQNRKKRTKLKKGNFVCNFCGKSFTFRSNLATHKKIIHAHHSVISCRSCKKIFKCQEDLNLHKALKHRGCLQDCENEAKLEKSRNFLCTLCGKTFTFLRNLSAHRKMIHAHYSIVSCKLCKNIFKCQEDLDEHKAVKHRGCLQDCIKKSKLKKGNFACNFCGKSFTFRSNLSTHQKIIHSDPSVIKCRGCKLVFKSQEDLDKHKILKHVSHQKTARNKKLHST